MRHSRVMLYGVTLDVRHLKTKPLLPWSEMSVPQILPTELRILFLPFFITGTTFLMAADSQIVVNVGQLFDIFVEMKGKKHEFGRRQGINGL